MDQKSVKDVAQDLATKFVSLDKWVQILLCRSTITTRRMATWPKVKALCWRITMKGRIWLRYQPILRCRTWLFYLKGAKLTIIIGQLQANLTPCRSPRSLQDKKAGRFGSRSCFRLSLGRECQLWSQVSISFPGCLHIVHCLQAMQRRNHQVFLGTHIQTSGYSFGHSSFSLGQSSSRKGCTQVHMGFTVAHERCTWWGGRDEAVRDKSRAYKEKGYDLVWGHSVGAFCIIYYPLMICLIDNTIAHSFLSAQL